MNDLATFRAEHIGSLCARPHCCRRGTDHAAGRLDDDG